MAYFKLKDYYNIVAFSDNNAALHCTECRELPVILPEEIKGKSDCVIICSDYYKEIYVQLINMGITDILAVDPLSFLLYTISNGRFMFPVKFNEPKKIKKVLFVQNTACIRTLKIAYLLKQRGIKVDLAYQICHPD